MKAQGEIEAAVCAGIGLFEQNMRVGSPKNIHHAHLLGDPANSIWPRSGGKNQALLPHQLRRIA